MCAPKSVQARRHARHTARGSADRVVHQLGAERHLQLEQLRVAALSTQARHGDEAVEVRRAAGRRVEVDRVPAPEQPGHDGFGDARRK
jgi:hypothetical protein